MRRACNAFFEKKAKELGFWVLQFNAVVKFNTVALHSSAAESSKYTY